LRAGGVAQVVEHLPSKCEALSSNHSVNKKKKEIIKKFHSDLPDEKKVKKKENLQDCHIKNKDTDKKAKTKQDIYTERDDR
jgi:hypothetical protein